MKWITLWRRTPRFRRLAGGVICGFLLAYLATVAGSPIVSVLLAAGATAYLGRSAIGIYADWKRFRILAALREHLQTRRRACDEALAAGDLWLARIHQCAWDRAMDEYIAVVAELSRGSLPPSSDR